MERPPFTTSIPNAGVDPIRAATHALDLISACATSPPTHQILVVALDERHRGIGILVVHDTFERDAVCEVARIAASGAPAGMRRAAIVASIRPGDPTDASDIERWHTCDALLADAGIELLEWFVIDDHVECPRVLTDAAPRWRP